MVHGLISFLMLSILSFLFFYLFLFGLVSLVFDEAYFGLASYGCASVEKRN